MIKIYKLVTLSLHNQLMKEIVKFPPTDIDFCCFKFRKTNSQPPQTFLVKHKIFELIKVRDNFYLHELRVMDFLSCLKKLAEHKRYEREETSLYFCNEV